LTNVVFQAGSDYGGSQQPRQASIKVTPDQRAVIITVVTDRVETARFAERMHRSPPERQKHRLSVTGSGTGADPLRVEALHAPLGDVVGAVSRAASIPVAARADAADVDVSLVLPAATSGQALQALSEGLGLTLTRRPSEEGGGFAIGRGGMPLLNERIPLKNISPENARLLFPDFLLPYLHADTEHNALVASGTPALLARLRQDLATLDVPRPQVRVEARVFEVSQPEDTTYVLQGAFASGKEAFNTDAGTVSVTLQPGQQQSYSARLQALIARGRARLAARPVVVVASGEKGTLFLGQTRLLPVLQNTFSGQTSTLLSIPIGTTLTVTPTASHATDGEILLNLSPRFTTVDAIEKGTGLPTVGIREVNCVVRVRPGDEILVAGLQSESDERLDNGFAPFARIPLLGWLFASHRTAKTRVTLVVSVTARLVGSETASSAVAPEDSPAKKGI
jgi:type II secretory pathway component GspD/PulD (secretin)